MSALVVSPTDHAYVFHATRHGSRGIWYIVKLIRPGVRLEAFKGEERANVELDVGRNVSLGFDFVSRGPNWGFAMYCYEMGDAMDYLVNSGVPLPEQEAASICKGGLAALQDMHDRGWAQVV